MYWVAAMRQVTAMWQPSYCRENSRSGRSPAATVGALFRVLRHLVEAVEEHERLALFE